MLLIRYLLEDYPNLTPEIRCDLFCGIRDGYSEGSLSPTQVILLSHLVRTNKIEDIARNSGVTTQTAVELLNAALAYLEEKTHYRDSDVLLSRKGRINPIWLLKAQLVAQTW